MCESKFLSEAHSAALFYFWEKKKKRKKYIYKYRGKISNWSKVWKICLSHLYDSCGEKVPHPGTILRRNKSEEDCRHITSRNRKTALTALEPGFNMKHLKRLLEAK